MEQRKNYLGKFLTDKLADLMPKVTVHLEADIGIAYEKFAKKAAKEGMDMIFMSTHGRTGLRHMLARSVTAWVSPYRIHQGSYPFLSCSEFDSAPVGLQRSSRPAPPPPDYGDAPKERSPTRGS